MSEELSLRNVSLRKAVFLMTVMRIMLSTRAAGEFPVNCRYRIEGLLTIPECSVLIDGDIIPCSESNILSGEIYYTYSRSAEQLFHAEIHVPDGTAVFVNGIELGTELLKNSDYIYDEISDFNDLVETPLTEQLYIVDRLL